MPRPDFRRLVYLQFAAFAVMVGAMGMAGFALMLWDFQFPGTFKGWYVFRGGMPQNLILLLSFGLQHSLMARRGFKQRLSRWIPTALERSFYVMLSGFVLFALSLLWSPSTPPLYDLGGTIGGYCLRAGGVLGLVIIGISALEMDAWDLIGVRALIHIWSGKQPEIAPFKRPMAYRWVRHPMYLGMLLLFWCTPTMTHDHLFFAEVMTAYILIGIQVEERDLVRLYGDDYRSYQRDVPMLLPLKRPRRQ
jgi:protein-S-isoprenylcysteine O-methyltransferase Ste14